MTIISMTINGNKIDLDTADLTIQDLSTEMDMVASQIAYWGHIWGQAEEDAVRADAWYRQWRNERGAVARTADEKGKEPAEWKVWNDVESQPKFVGFKTAIAEAARNVTTSKAIFEAFKAKASILQSKGAMQRAEMENLGMSTPSTPRERPRVQVERDGLEAPEVGVDSEPAVSGTRTAPVLPGSVKKKEVVAKGAEVMRAAVISRSEKQGGSKNTNPAK